MATFTKVILYADADGRSKFREEQIALSEGTPQVMLSQLYPSSGFQLRCSPIGFSTGFHCGPVPQYVFILSGAMEVGLQDGTWRRFEPGQHFYSMDLMPAGSKLDPSVHGHASRQVGDVPLVTLFVRG